MKKALLLVTLLALVIALATACFGGDDDDDNGGDEQPPVSGQQPPVTPPPAGGNQDDEDDVVRNIGDTVFAGWQPFPEGFPEEWEDFHERFEMFNNHFTPVDLGGITLRINSADPENIEDDIAREAAQFRRDWVQQSFNITLEFDAIAGIEWSDVPDQIIASVAAGDPIVHLMRGTNANNWVPRLATADVLVPDNGWIVQNFPENWWAGFGEFGGQVVGFESEFPFAANMGLVYNRDMIQRSGIAYTPSEMFRQGRWSHDDFYNYLSELAVLLPEGVVPLHAPFNQLGLGLAFANGTQVRDSSTNLPLYLEEPFLEVVRFMQRMGQSGVMSPPGFDAATGVWSAGAAFFQPAVPKFQADQESAMTVLQRWQFGGASELVEFGFVPYPWGSNVQWPASGNWADLVNNGYASFVNDANIFTVIRNDLGITHELAASITFSFLLHTNSLNAMQAFAAGEGNPVPAPNLAQLFEDEDRELWQWYADSARADVTSGRVTLPGTFWGAVQTSIGANTDIRPAFESIIGEDIFNMVDRGQIELANVPAEMIAFMDSFIEGQDAE